jgi:hypothetical protein
MPLILEDDFPFRAEAGEQSVSSSLADPETSLRCSFLPK